MKIYTVILFLFTVVNFTYSQGLILVPERPPLKVSSSITLKSTDITAQIKNGIADVTVNQIFYNPTDQRLEGEYLFMVRGEAQLYDFNLYIDGKKVKGELLDGEKAFNTYTRIVRSLKDPALMAYAGHGIFKARIFPINPYSERKIEFSYAQVLEFENDQSEFIFPLKNFGQINSGKIHLALSLEENAPVGNIYSPSHVIDVQQTEQKEARISVETSYQENQQDFKLVYSLSDEDVHHSLLDFRPRTDRDGYFMLMMSPNINTVKPQNIARDIIFVIDVSGSMQGDKILQARDALTYCIGTLGPEDRFDIISFSSSIRPFSNRLTPATNDNLENARYFIDNLNASGGTNINQALQKALALKQASGRRQTDIIFLTDGLPTEGVTDVVQILRNYQKASRENMRVFAFGVGFDVNTYLLDKLSRDSRGRSEYVKPGEAIESAISSLFAKISKPYLTDISLTFDGTTVHDYYPQKISDMYIGERISVMGRYPRGGKLNIYLQGKSGLKTQRYQYQVILADREMDNEFVSKLWANRKVQYLLSEIRFNGENQELIESVRQLGTEYGIITPYTSYLVTEQEQEFMVLDDLREAGESPAVSQSRLLIRKKDREQRAEVDDETVGSDAFYEALAAIPQAAEKSVGRGAVYSSRVMKELEENDKSEDMLLTVMRAAGRTFHLRNGIWLEQGISEQAVPDRVISFLSDEYMDLLASETTLRKILSIGERIKFSWDKKIYEIQLEG